MYVYVRNEEENTYSVGFYDPGGQWHVESELPNDKAAANRVHWLNGGQKPKAIPYDIMRVNNSLNAIIGYGELIHEAFEESSHGTPLDEEVMERDLERIVAAANEIKDVLQSNTG